MFNRDLLPVSRFDDYFDRIFRSDRMFPAPWRRDLEEFEWEPRADITESRKEYLVTAELPEVTKDDIHVDVSDGVLSIRGERRYEKADQDEQTHRRERFFGRFERRFLLPEDVDVKGLKAESRDGVLRVHLPKLAAAKKTAPVQVRIQ